MKNVPHSPHAAHFCPNCDSALGANFCPNCGQPAHLHVPSAREFLHEFIAHYVALEGKLWKSIGLLMFRPGRLTREYIEGRRVPYVEPLRLYLSFSIIFFALFKFGNHEVIHLGSAERGPAQVEAAAPAAPKRAVEEAAVEEAAAEKAETRTAATTGDRDVDKVIRDVDRINESLGAKVHRFFAQPRHAMEEAFRHAFFSYAPYTIFALMPLFAAYLKLLYLGSGRRYGEHLLFALHSNAFAFLILSLLLILPSGIPLLAPALSLWLVFYLPTAMRKVYGGGRTVTALRWITLMSLHFCSMVVGVLAVAVLAIVA